MSRVHPIDGRQSAMKTKERESKEWSSLYEKRRRERLADEEELFAPNETVEEKWAKQFLALRIVIRLRKKIRTRRYAGRKTLENLKPPSKPMEWDNGRFRERSRVCEECFEPALTGIVACRGCNLVFHKNCLSEEDAEEFDFCGAFLCLMCQKVESDEENLYQTEKARLIQERRERLCAKLIVRRARCFLQRKRYRKSRLSTVIIQSVLRQIVVKKRMLKFKQAMIRPFRVKIEGICNFKNPLVFDLLHFPEIMVITSVVDSISAEQIYRYDGQKFPTRLSEDGTIRFKHSHLIGYFHGNTNLVFTILLLSGYVKNWIAIGQTILQVKGSGIHITGGEFREMASHNLQFIPIETKDAPTHFSTSMQAENITPSLASTSSQSQMTSSSMMGERRVSIGDLIFQLGWILIHRFFVFDK